MFNCAANLADGAPDLLRDGLRCERRITWPGLPGGPFTAEPSVNVAEELHAYDIVQLDWLGGDETAALALEVLDRYLPPAWGQCATWRGGRTLHTSAAALYLHRPFARFIEPHLDFWGGIISRDVILLWLRGEGLGPMMDHVGAWPPSRVFQGTTLGQATS